MNKIYESQYYDISYRSIMTKDKNIKVFTEKDYIEIENEINFDVEASYKSAVNYFVSSIVGGIMKNIINNGKRKNIIIEEFESVTKIQIENPLTFLNVKGYDEEPKIKSCNIKMYMYSNVEDEELINFCKENLKKCIIYNTLKNTMEINIQFVVLD